MRQRFYASPQNFTIVKQAVSTTKAPFVMPVLYLRQADNSVTRFNLLIEFFLAYPFMSREWRKIAARSIGLLWDYLLAQGLSFDWTNSDAHRQIIADFTMALHRGTFRPNELDDPLHLYWPPSSQKQCKKIMRAILEFIEWCITKGFKSNVGINSKSSITPESLTAFLYVAKFQKNISFMAHLKRSDSIANDLRNRHISSPIQFGSPNKAPNYYDPAKAFPKDLVSTFLNEGFVLNPLAESMFDREDITAKMIAYLLFFTGLRRSEPLHLWFNDIDPTNKDHLVLLAHPEFASTRLRYSEQLSRSQYLKLHKLSPRNIDDGSKSMYAGWKEMKMDIDFTAPAYWINETAEQNFRKMAYKYLRHREVLMNYRKAAGGFDHPFYFVSNGFDHSKRVDYRGAPYSYAAFGKAWDRALNRTGKILGKNLVPTKFSGLTPHGGRHFYGTMLQEMKLDEKFIQECMHHKSIFSQKVYTVPSSKQVMDTMNELGQRNLPIQNFKLI